MLHLHYFQLNFFIHIMSGDVRQRLFYNMYLLSLVVWFLLLALYSLSPYFCFALRSIFLMHCFMDQCSTFRCSTIFVKDKCTQYFALFFVPLFSSSLLFVSLSPHVHSLIIYFPFSYFSIFSHFSSLFISQAPCRLFVSFLYSLPLSCPPRCAFSAVISTFRLHSNSFGQFNSFCFISACVPNENKWLLDEFFVWFWFTVMH